MGQGGDIHSNFWSRGGLELDDLQGPFQHEPFCDSMTLTTFVGKNRTSSLIPHRKVREEMLLRKGRSASNLRRCQYESTKCPDP